MCQSWTHDPAQGWWPWGTAGVQQHVMQDMCAVSPECGVMLAADDMSMGSIYCPVLAEALLAGKPAAVCLHIRQ